MKPGSHSSLLQLLAPISNSLFPVVRRFIFTTISSANVSKIYPLSLEIWCSADFPCLGEQDMSSLFPGQIFGFRFSKVRISLFYSMFGGPWLPVLAPSCNWFQTVNAIAEFYLNGIVYRVSSRALIYQTWGARFLWTENWAQLSN